MRMLASLSTLAALVLAVASADVRAADDDTPKAAKTRKLLKTKISVEFKDTGLREAMEEITAEAKGVRFIFDTKNGVSLNQKVTYSAKDKSIEVILDELLKKPDLGYIVVSDPKKNATYDGAVQIRKTKERGTPKN